MRATLARIFADARFGLRLLRRSPIFGISLLGILVAGIGATTAMFSLVVGLLVRPLPFPHPEELTLVMQRQPSAAQAPISVPDFLDWRARQTSFRQLAVVDNTGYTLAVDGEVATTVSGAAVSADFFDIFELPPLRGRYFVPTDDRVGAPRVAVISASLWRERFASDPNIIGRTVTLSSESWTIVGVAAEGFSFSSPRGQRSQVWTPIQVTLTKWEEFAREGRGSHFLQALGRRKPGVTLAAAGAELARISRDLETAYPATNTGVSGTVEDLQLAIVGPARANVWILFGAVGIVFLVVCANVANLLLARASARRSEMAARAALGASGRRLAAQLVTETAAIFVVAALGGAALARLLVGFFGRGIVTASGVPAVDVAVDAWALAFAITTALVCGLVFGLIPAVEVMRVPPAAVLKDASTRTSARGGQRVVRGGLVIVQVALAFALLAVSGAMLRAFQRVMDTPLGYEPEGVASFVVWLPATKYDPPRTSAFWETVQRRLAAEPGVRSVSGSDSIPLGHSNSSGSFEIEGRTPWARGTQPMIDRNCIMPGYLATIGTKVLRGRPITEEDVATSKLVMVISQRAAERFFPGEDPIGHRIDFGESETDHTWREIVGVVEDVNHTDRKNAISPEAYMPVTQMPQEHMFFVVRSGRSGALLSDVPRIIGSLDPYVSASDRMEMSERVERSVRAQRFTTALLGAFALAGLVLATLGIFGLVSYTTNQRTRELGIRIALGIPARAVLALVMREGLRLLAVGLGFGLVAAILLGKQVAENVREAKGFEPLVLAAILVVLGAGGMLASLLPALRAIRIPPASALRYE